MGQPVAIRNSVAMGRILLVDTDRSFTGQDGESITPEEPGNSVPGRLAGRLFDLGIGVDHVHVLQNTVSVRRDRDWDGDSVSAAGTVLEDFLRFYL
jgi:hypothetical protein